MTRIAAAALVALIAAPAQAERAVAPVPIPLPSVSAPARWADAEIVLKLSPGRRFLPSPPGLARTGSTSLDERLASAGAFEAVPVFPVARADRLLHAALEMDRFYRVRLRRPADIPALAAELKRHPDVEWAEPDYEGSAAGALAVSSVIPNDPAFERQWGFRNTGFVPGLGPSTAGADIHAVDGWTITTGDSAVVVAVLDSGIRYDYPEFAGRVWTNPGEIAGNGVDDDANGYVDDVRGWNFAYGTAEVLDDLGHGNAVSGVIGAASNDGVGYCGLDWACRIMPVKILSSGGTGNYSWWVSGIYYAVNEGARVINMSVVGLQPSLFLQTACRYAFERDCLVVAAMGNSGAATRYIPASFENEVVAVGATDRFDLRSGFSTFGNHVELVAPGQEIAALVLGTERYTSFGSGTSFASPMVAGLAALLLAKDPSFGAAALRDILCASADDGIGDPREDVPGFDPYYGFGRINCFRALTLDRVPRAPTVTAPAFVSAVEGRTVSIPATVVEPDGDGIARFEADLSSLPRMNDAVFTTSADRLSGVLTWTPTFEDAGGPYSITFRAFDPLKGQAVTTLYVANVNRLPALVAPEAVVFTEGESGGFDVSASDPDGEDLFLSAPEVPAGATFEDRGDGTGAFAWTPDPGTAGMHEARFAVSDGWSDGTASATTRLDVKRPNRAPVAEAGGPYSGVAGAPIGFDASGSADPDGDALRYAWRFGDGSEGTGAAPSHAYAAGGDYAVTLEVSDGVLASSDSTHAAVRGSLPARAFLPDGHRSWSLSGVAPACVCLEPAEGSYANADLELSSLALVSAGTGSVVSIASDPRTIAERDRDRNGILDLTVCFRREEVRRLFDSVGGRDSVFASVEARLAGGARVRAPLALVIVGGERTLAVSSNPLAAGSVITFRSTRPGPVRVRLFDARGRLVRTLAEEPAARAGYHDLAFDGRGARGTRLPSGIYFLRAETPDGVATSRVAVLK